MGDRISYLEHVLGSIADKDGLQLQGLKEAHAKHAAAQERYVKDLDALKSHHASKSERLDYLEKVIGDSADQHGKKLREIEMANAKHAKGIEDVLAHHASVAERLRYLEGVVGDSCDKHAKDLMMLKNEHAMRSKDWEGVSSNMAERLEALEKAFSFETTQKLKAADEQLNSTMTMFEQFRSRGLR